MPLQLLEGQDALFDAKRGEAGEGPPHAALFVRMRRTFGKA
jgi:hypothetical protein